MPPKHGGVGEFDASDGGNAARPSVRATAHTTHVDGPAIIPGRKRRKATKKQVEALRAKIREILDENGYRNLEVADYIVSKHKDMKQLRKTTMPGLCLCASCCLTDIGRFVLRLSLVLR